MSTKKSAQLTNRLDKATREEDVQADPHFAPLHVYHLNQPEEAHFLIDRLSQLPLRLSRFKIASWDAGWWQARSALADQDLARPELDALKAAHAALRDKLLPQLAELGFLP